MISRTVKIQLTIFVLLSFIGVVYTGFNYVGIHGIGPLKFKPDPYTIRMELSDSGGIYTDAPVTYRGVQVGKVGTLRLAPQENPNGVEVDLKIDHDKFIPVDTLAQVANLSAVGEQYVILLPQTDDGPYFRRDGKTKNIDAATFTIPTDRTSIPVDDAVLLKNTDLLVNSVNKQNLTIVIDELAKATQGTGPDLQRLIDSGNQLLTAAQNALPQTLQLINDGNTVLKTQADVADSFKAFNRNLNLLSQQLVTSDPDVRKLFDNGALAAQQLQSLIQANQQTLPAFFGNLVTLGQIQQVRLQGLQTILVLYPLMAAVTPTALDKTDGSGLATAQFVAATNNAPVACDFPQTNSGYQSTYTNSNGTVRSPIENPANPGFRGFGGAANLNTLCLAPDASSNSTYQPSSGASAYRGAGTVPRPAGDTTGKPGGSIGTSTNPNVPNFYYTPYSPTSGDFHANGQAYHIDDASATTPMLGGQALSWVLVNGAS